VAAKLKWPNDLMFAGRKLGGILCETEPAASTSSERAVAVGLGVNLSVASFPPDVRGISLHEIAPPPTALALLHDWVARFGDRVLTLERDGLRPLLDDWRRHAVGLGEPVRAVGPSGEVAGVAVDIGDDGALLISTPSGIERVIAADVHIASEPA
jgi:BirA family biotin operon repressor/biotin-[acetyl-CoA-carboxylase] ligase